MAETARAPVRVTLVTGFLGSGKTTLLQRLLRDRAFADTAVLINELGEIALDHQLLERIDETMVVLKSGCVCCTIRSPLGPNAPVLDRKPVVPSPVERLLADGEHERLEFKQTLRWDVRRANDSSPGVVRGGEQCHPARARHGGPRSRCRRSARDIGLVALDLSDASFAIFTSAAGPDTTTIRCAPADGAAK